jgi:hypothetical protein
MRKVALQRAARLVMLPLLSTLSVGAVAQAASSCKALVQVDNNLWFASADGRPLAQVTNDRQFRSAAALDPNGTLIAYSGKDAPNDVTLIDASGRPITDIDLKASDAIIDLKWISPTLLSATEHLGPKASHFHVVQLGAGSATASVLPVTADGSSCAVSSSGKVTACIIGDRDLELNGRHVYGVTDAFASATEVQTVDAAVGTSLTSSTSPAFRVDVKAVTGAAVHLRITTPDGLWTEQYVPPGEAMDVQFAGPPEGAPRYAVVPITTTNTGVVRLTIKRSNSGDYAFEGGVAWDPRGKRIALVEANSAGQRTWVLLNSEMGQAAIRGSGAIDAKESLPVAGPVRSISFPSDTRLRIEGASQVFEKDIPAQGKVPPGGAYAIRPALPQQLTLKLAQGSVVAAVKGWSCP